MKTIVVTAAIIERDGRFLVTRRQAGTHLAGVWEFPGGKCHPGETLGDCLRRELREELALNVIVGTELLATTHEYDDRRVELHFLTCDMTNEPVPQLGQEMQWVARADLANFSFPPADEDLIRTLRSSR